MNYTIKVGSTGKYNLNTTLSSAAAGSTFHYEVDGKNVSGEITVPNTSGWYKYTTLTQSNINLSVGQHLVRLIVDSTPAGFGANISSFSFTTPTAAPVTPVTPVTPTNPTKTPVTPTTPTKTPVTPTKPTTPTKTKTPKAPKAHTPKPPKVSHKTHSVFGQVRIGHAA